MLHDEILAIAADLPTRVLLPGTILIEESEPNPGLYILREGTLEVRRNGRLIAVVGEAGSMVGEMACLLRSPSTADVVARDEVRVHTVDDPDAFLASHPDVALFLARILAQRLHAVNGYLADLRGRQGDIDHHLGLASAMVEHLLASRGTTIDVGDEPTEAELAALERESS